MRARGRRLAETVAVEAAAPLVDVQSAGIGDVVENERILELPLQGRKVTDLIVLAGAAVQTGKPRRHFRAACVSRSPAGMPIGVGVPARRRACTTTRRATSNLPLPFPDALQEFRVATSGCRPQNGDALGASVNAVTKSGTNTFHGNVFEFLRDHRFNATNRSPPSARRQAQDDGLERNQFGGTLGGPIVRDKLFFFGGYQGTTLRQKPADNIAFVPTAAMLAGDFTAFASPACNGGRQVDLRRAVRQQPHQSRALQPGGDEPRPAAADHDHPCGEITYHDGGRLQRRPVRRPRRLSVERQSFAVRPLHGHVHQEDAGYQAGTDNILLARAVPGSTTSRHSSTLGDTVMFGPNMVNAFRVGVQPTLSTAYNTPIFDPYDLGVKRLQLPSAGQIVD